MAYIDAQLESGEYPQIRAMFSADRAETWVRLAEATLDPFRFERGLSGCSTASSMPCGGRARCPPGDRIPRCRPRSSGDRAAVS